MIQLRGEGLELFFFNSLATPDALRIQLSEVVDRIERDSAKSGGGPNPNLANQLVELGQLFQQGLLTAAEFAVAKSRLLG